MKPIAMTRVTKPLLALAAAATLAIVLMAAWSPAHAAEDPDAGLFVNLATIDPTPAGHALLFAGKQRARGHPVVVFLNGKAVWIATKGAPQFTYGATGKTLQAMLQDLMAQGVEVIVCQACAKDHGVSKDTLIEGAPLGNPELVGSRLFDPAYKVISW